MDVIYTAHALEKFRVLREGGWNLPKRKIEQILKRPKWTGTSRFGQATAMGLIDKKHIVRIIFNTESGRIKVITFHIARRGKYESTF